VQRSKACATLPGVARAAGTRGGRRAGWHPEPELWRRRFASEARPLGARPAGRGPGVL